MATTYKTIVNELLSEINEVQLTDANFDSARNIQRFVKECVNRAYMDIHSEEYKWPWTAVSNSQDNYLGNTYIETVAGTRWYLLNPSSSDIDTDYAHIDWEHFALTEEGVAGKTAPYEIRNLKQISIETWRDYYAVTEERDKSDSQSYGVPIRVIRNPDGKRFGLSPIPDEVYRIYFFAWNTVSELSAATDEILIPTKYLNVLRARARYYIWQFKAQEQLAAFALDEYKKGLAAMRRAVKPEVVAMKSDRMRFI